MKQLLNLTVLIFLYSCSNSQFEQAHKVIDLASNLNDNPVEFVLDEIAVLDTVFEVANSDSTLLSFAFPQFEWNGHLYINTTEALIDIDINTGHILNYIGRSGKGPGEYQFLNSTAFDPINKYIFVSDRNPNRILKYGFNGGYIDDIPINNASEIAVLDSNHLVVTSSSRANEIRAFEIFNDRCESVRKSLQHKKILQTALRYNDLLFNRNDGCYFRGALCDTIYSVNTISEKVFCVINKGKYKIPDELYASLSQLDALSHRYIYEERISFNSRYLFIMYWYESQKYMDIWDIENERLLGRNVYNPFSDVQMPGFKVRINDRMVNVHPCFMSDKYMICQFCELEELSKIDSNLSIDSNPVLLIMRFKTI